MEALSPFTRRVLALGILVLLVMGTLELIVVPLFGALRFELGHLGDLRFERVQTEMVAGRPPPPPVRALPPGSYLVAARRGDATQQLIDRLREAASAAGVTVASASAASEPVPPAQVTVDLAAEGPELKMIAFLRAVEGGALLVRMREWRLSVDERQLVHLTARPTAAWGLG